MNMLDVISKPANQPTNQPNKPFSFQTHTLARWCNNPFQGPYYPHWDDLVQVAAKGEGVANS